MRTTHLRSGKRSAERTATTLAMTPALHQRRAWTGWLGAFHGRHGRGRPFLQQAVRLAGEKVRFQGFPGRICWLAHGERAKMGLVFNALVSWDRGVKIPSKHARR